MPGGNPSFRCLSYQPFHQFPADALSPVSLPDAYICDIALVQAENDSTVAENLTGFLFLRYPMCRLT